MAKTVREKIEEYVMEQDMRLACNGTCDTLEDACLHGLRIALDDVVMLLPSDDSRLLNDAGNALVWRIKKRIKELELIFYRP